MIGITGHGPGIGDAIIKTSFPENYFRNTGEKLVDLDHHWVYDYNPYVVRNQNALKVFNFVNDQIQIITSGKRKTYKSDAEEYCSNYNLKKLYLKSPRLYAFESLSTVMDRVVVHIQGKTCGLMDEHVRSFISEKYKNFDLIQIGSGNEPILKNAKNFLGLPKWDCVKLIASAAVFIGVNSGFYHISNCYPSVRTKIILNYNEDRLNEIIPRDHTIGCEWYNYDVEYFNTFDHDVGITRSYHKI